MPQGRQPKNVQELIKNCYIHVTPHFFHPPGDEYKKPFFHRPDNWQNLSTSSREELTELIDEGTQTLGSFFDKLSHRQVRPGDAFRRRYVPDGKGLVKCDWPLNIAIGIQQHIQFLYNQIIYNPARKWPVHPKIIAEDVEPALLDAKELPHQPMFSLHYTVLYVPPGWDVAE